jgi:DNA repair protein RecO (recombination protein O)
VTDGQHRTRALLLRRVEYGEADLVVRLLTEEEGRRSLFARGARKSQRRFAGALEPFRVIEAVYRAGDGGGEGERLGRLEEATVLEGFDRITGDLHRLCWASVVLEWTSAMTVEGEPSPVFETAVDLLRWLAGHERTAWHTEVGCLRYALVLLSSAGLMPQLAACVRTGRALATLEEPVFSLAAGGLLDAGAARPEDLARPVSAEAVDFLLAIARGKFPPACDNELLRQARSLLVRGLAALTESEPKSLEMLRSVWL